MVRMKRCRSHCRCHRNKAAIWSSLPEDHGEGPEFAPDRVEDQPQGLEGDHAEQDPRRK